jgi:DNA-binding transcriptional LysR family regulator
MLNLHHLHIFQVVAQRRSFTRAAETLYISQPAVSRQVRELEQALGVALVDRVGHRLFLTDAGTALFAASTRLFGVATDIERDMAERRALTRGRLLLGASQTIGVYVLPGWLATYHQVNPQVELVAELGTTDQTLERVASYALEFGLVEGPVGDPTLASSVILRDELVLIMPPFSLLTATQETPLAALQREAFVLREPTAATRQFIERVLGAAGVSLRVVLELNSNEAVKQAVAAGLGLGIVSSATVTQELAAGRLGATRIAGLRMTRDWSVVTLSERRLSPAATAFLAVVRASVAVRRSAS